MALTLDLTPEMEDRLKRAATRHGMSPPDYALNLLQEQLEAEEEEGEVTLPATGAELVASLQQAGVIGAWADRTDIGDSSEYARMLRKEAETRTRD